MFEFIRRASGLIQYESFLLCLLVCLSIVLQCSAAKQKNLEIIKQFVPDDCVETADTGDEVEVHYTGYLDSGVMFDTSHQANRGPLPFVLGQGRVIKGWEQGIQGMCVGEKRKLIIPSHLAYGKQGHPPIIPGDATLTFETELISIQKKGAEETILRILRFLSLPCAVLFAVYFLYKRVNNQETTSGKKGSRGRGRKKRE